MKKFLRFFFVVRSSINLKCATFLRIYFFRADSTIQTGQFLSCLKKFSKKILTLQYDTFCRNRKTFCNAFRNYSKSQTRNFFATSKKFFDKILHRDVADYQNLVVTEMYLFVTLRNLDVAEM